MHFCLYIVFVMHVEKTSNATESKRFRALNIDLCIILRRSHKVRFLYLKNQNKTKRYFEL